MILSNIEELVKLIIKEKVAMPILAKIDRHSTDSYTCDCIELDNEGQETDTIYTRVRIPRMIAHKNGGVFFIPQNGTVVLLNFLNGDRNYPIISAVLGGEETPNGAEDTLIIKCGETEIRLDDKIIIKAGGESLGELLEDMASYIAELTTVGSPTTQTLRPDQIAKWEILKSKKIKNLFHTE